MIGTIARLLRAVRGLPAAAPPVSPERFAPPGSGPAAGNTDCPAGARDDSRIDEEFAQLLVPPRATSAELAASALAAFRDRAAASRFEVRSLPRLPAVLPELLRRLRSDTGDSAALATLIGRDRVLLGEVIRVANSAAYRGRRAIGSLAQAVVLLGDEGLRRVVVNVLVRPIHGNAAGTLGRAAIQQLNDHAEHCAQYCASQRATTGERFEAYLAGTFAWSGAMSVISLFDLDRSLHPAAKAPEFVPAFTAACIELSVRIVRHWQLPEATIAAIAELAQPTLDPAERSALGRVLLAGDREAKAAVLGLAPGLAGDSRRGP